ncbi:MAG: Outer membrane lipoprotein omp16 precursor [uncultured Campylobacterales bacterium]|uniref:Outer membrane lipoprotein omp16 n=1 Tax=uncultured Campylobacterales bacterium TaxID=352960 RepID=A0A6S6T4F4_9BACT|nr:MAG: Outer membrane lipoprotein omp16 precursor [uncultured Campylobacterales bacterium]
MKNLMFLTVLITLYSGCSSKNDNVDIPVIIDDNTSQTDNNIDDSMIASDIGMSSFIKEDFTIGLPTDSILDIKDRTQNIYFGVDKYNIREEEKVKVTFNTKLISSDDLVNKRIVLEGNCDEWGSDEYNYALGLKRARAVKKALIVQGIDKSRLALISYGEGNFVCEDKTKACWSKNRRVEFNIKD